MTTTLAFGIVIALYAAIGIYFLVMQFPKYSLPLIALAISGVGFITGMPWVSFAAYCVGFLLITFWIRVFVTR